jgi:tetratricopeptide (TPR) repeat protein
MLRRAWLLVLLLLAAAPGRVRADAKTEARAHLDRATALHREGKLAEAIHELTLAYSLDSQPDLLYAIAQVHVQLGQCPQAILFYERFLSTRPDDMPAAAAAEAIDVCRNAPGSVAPAAASAPPAAGPSPARPERPDRWYADRLGGALLGGGVVLGVTAAVTYAAARSDLDEAEAAADYRAHDELVGRARGKRTIAVALGAGAAALTGAAVTRYLLRRRADARAVLGIAPTRAGGLVTWSGRF